MMYCLPGNRVSKSLRRTLPPVLSHRSRSHMSRTGQPAIRHVAAVERALAVLDALSTEESELGTNEIARRTGINASTVSRLLATLADAGMVEHVAATGRYRLRLAPLQHGPKH